MVDILLEYGYYIVGAALAIISIITSYFAARKYIREWRTEQKNELKTLVTGQIDRVIDSIDSNTAVTNEKFIRTDQALKTNSNDITDIEKDIKILEEDFKSLCQTIGKHEYIVDKVFPEYVELRDSIHSFKSKVNQNILSNNEPVSRNTEDDSGQEGLK